MASPKQRAAARNNIKKAAKVAKRKRTISHLPKKTRTALGKEAAKAAEKSGTNFCRRNPVTLANLPTGPAQVRVSHFQAGKNESADNGGRKDKSKQDRDASCAVTLPLNLRTARA
jgi:hypothetical protein